MYGEYECNNKLYTRAHTRVFFNGFHVCTSCKYLKSDARGVFIYEYVVRFHSVVDQRKSARYLSRPRCVCRPVDGTRNTRSVNVDVHAHILWTVVFVYIYIYQWLGSPPLLSCLLSKNVEHKFSTLTVSRTMFRKRAYRVESSCFTNRLVGVHTRFDRIYCVTAKRISDKLKAILTVVPGRCRHDVR